MDAKIIRPSNSPCASPVVLCRKKNFDLRMVSDYRILNSPAVKDSYSVPKIEEFIVTLSGARCFTSMDLCKAVYHVPMTEHASRLLSSHLVDVRHVAPTRFVAGDKTCLHLLGLYLLGLTEK